MKVNQNKALTTTDLTCLIVLFKQKISDLNTIYIKNNNNPEINSIPGYGE